VDASLEQNGERAKKMKASEVDMLSEELDISNADSVDWLCEDR
jgi:hypothetical protein